MDDCRRQVAPRRQILASVSPVDVAFLVFCSSSHFIGSLFLLYVSCTSSDGGNLIVCFIKVTLSQHVRVELSPRLACITSDPTPFHSKRPINDGVKEQQPKRTPRPSLLQSHPFDQSSSTRPVSAPSQARRASRRFSEGPYWKESLSQAVHHARCVSCTT